MRRSVNPDDTRGEGGLACNILLPFIEENSSSHDVELVVGEEFGVPELAPDARPVIFATKDRIHSV